jgi:DNA-directed RNA polymerase specialized sigma24 family protein
MDVGRRATESFIGAPPVLILHQRDGRMRLMQDFSTFPASSHPRGGLANGERLNVLTQEVLREEPGITQNAFSRLLAWLDEGVDSNGERYLEMRRRLVGYFDRRGRPAADELADETLNRIARTLMEAGAIAVRPPARYCYVVARFVLLEDVRRQRGRVPLDESRHANVARVRVESDQGWLLEHRLDCLDRCLQQLKPAQRELIVEYYADERRQKIERRRDLAKSLGITMNALGIRALRIRDGLMACMGRCPQGR